MDSSTRDVLMTLITVAGTVVSAFFASRSKRHAGRANVAAVVAVQASMKPPRMPTQYGTHPGITFVDLEGNETTDDDESPATPRDMSVARKEKP